MTPPREVRRVSGPRAGGRRMARAVVMLGVVALGVLATRPGMASAHAFLIRAQPGDGLVVSRVPRALRLWFSEPIDLPPTPLELFGPDGRRVPLSAVAVAPDDATEMVVGVGVGSLTRGTYTVLWKAISADTHPVWGEFTFSVGAPSPIVAPIAHASVLFQDGALALQALARLLTLLSLALLVGPLALWAGGLAPAVVAHAPTRILAVWRRTMRLYEGAVALLVMALPLTLAAQMMSVSDSLASALSLDAFVAVARDRLGGLIGLRLALGLGFFVVGAVILYLGPGRLLRSPRQGRVAAVHPVLLVAATLAGVLTLSISLGGHAAVTTPVLLSLSLDMLHLGAMALWVGGLCALVAVLAPALRSLPREQRDRVLATVIPRFSALALACVLTLTLTGLYSTVRNLGSPRDLLTSDYGRALGVKLLVSLAILPVASVNLFVLRPLLARVAAGHARAADLWPPLRALLRAEALLALSVLVSVGLLTALPPARQPENAYTTAIGVSATGRGRAPTVSPRGHPWPYDPHARADVTLTTANLTHAGILSIVTGVLCRTSLIRQSGRDATVNDAPRSGTPIDALLQQCAQRRGIDLDDTGARPGDEAARLQVAEHPVHDLTDGAHARGHLLLRQPHRAARGRALLQQQAGQPLHGMAER